MRTYSSLPHLNGNLMAAVDVETTGRRANWHEIVQIAVVPLDSDIRPLEGVTPFYMTVQPLHPERVEEAARNVHGLDLTHLALYAPHPDKVADMFVEWFEKLNLPLDKKLVPLAQNWAFESSFLQAWLGVALKEKLFMGLARDSMSLALSINDRAVFRGESAPFNKVNLGYLCSHFGIVNNNAHDAFADCIAEAEVYRSMMYFDI